MNFRKLLSAGLAALGIIIIPLLVLPQYSLIGLTKEAIETRQAGLDKKKALMEKIEDLKKKTQERKNDMDKLATIIPQTKKTQDIVVNLEEMARETGITVKTVKTAKVSTRGQDFGTLQVEVSASGQYKSLFEFIKLMEKNLRVLDLQEFTLSLDTSAASAGGLNFATKMHTYFVE